MPARAAGRHHRLTGRNRPTAPRAAGRPDARGGVPHGRQARTPLAAADLDPATGRARLSYPRAEEIFNEMTKALAHPDITDPPSSPTHLDGRCTS